MLNTAFIRPLVCSVFAAAIAIGTPARAQDTPVAITNAMIFDATGADPFLGTVVIEDGRILAVTEGESSPAGAEILDAGGGALLPGLFDVHTHWSPSGTPPETAQIAAAFLAAGITSVNDFHQAPESYEPRRARLDELQAPHVAFAARMSASGGHGADWADRNTTRWVDSPEAARAAVREIAAYRPDLIKVFSDGWRYGLYPNRNSVGEDTLSAIVAEAQAHGLPVATHTVSVERAAEAARAGVSLIAHSVQDRLADEAMIAAMLEAGTAYAPTLAVYEPAAPQDAGAEGAETASMQVSRAKFRFATENLRMLSEAGVLIAVGTDSGIAGVPHGEATHRELELMVEAGLSPRQVLMAATSNSARAMRVSEDRGTIEAGRRADLVLVDGRPWERISDIRHIRRVWLDGVAADGAAPQDAPQPAQAVAALIDDFEREDGRTRLDTLRLEDFDGGRDRSTQITQRIPRIEGGHALNVSADLSVKDDPYAGVIFPLRRGGVAAAEVSDYDGLRFDLRGDGQAYQLRLHGEAESWVASVGSSAGWTTQALPFSAFRTEDGGRAFAGEPVREVRLRMQRPGGATGWLEIDNIGFYRDGETAGEPVR